MEKILTPIICDFGSQNTKIGFSGYDKPKYNISSSVRSIFPITRGNVTNWDTMEKLYDQTFRTLFNNRIDLNNINRPVLITKQPLSNRKQDEKITQIMFEKYKVSHFYLANQSTLALYASGRTSGVVVDIGHGVTSIVPIYDGYVMSKNIIKHNYGGIDITSKMTELLNNKGFLLSNDSYENIKKKTCYIAPNFEEKLILSEINDSNENYELLDGSTITIGSDRFVAPEILFKPSLFGLENDGIHQSIYNSINNCDIDLRKDLYNNILLTGGTSLIPNIQKRVTNELKNILQTNNNFNIDPNVFTTPECEYASWLGGSIITSLDSFNQMWITKQEYDDFGPSIVHNKCFL